MVTVIVVFGGIILSLICLTVLCALKVSKDTGQIFHDLFVESELIRLREASKWN